MITRLTGTFTRPTMRPSAVKIHHYLLTINGPAVLANPKAIGSVDDPTHPQIARQLQATLDGES